MSMNIIVCEVKIPEVNNKLVEQSVQWMMEKTLLYLCC